jgi:hypothetical protein
MRKDEALPKTMFVKDNVCQLGMGRKPMGALKHSEVRTKTKEKEEQ